MVEVSSNEEGFKGAWHVATIVKSPAFSKSKRKPMVLVQYKDLVSDNDENVPLAENVDPSFVRPIPPVSGITDKFFEEYDVVDAFHKDGWWKGVVRSVKVIDEVTKRYSVLFETVIPPEEVEFGPNDLRFHCEWIKGQWVRTPNQKYTSTAHGQTATRDGSENQKEQSSPGDSKSMAKREKKRTPTKLEEPLVCFSKKFKKDESTNEGGQATSMQTEPTNQRIQVTDNAITKCTTQLLGATNPVDGFEAALMRRKMESLHTKPSDGFEAALMRKMGHDEADIMQRDEIEGPTEKVEWAKWRLSSQAEEQIIKGESAEYTIEKYADSSAALVAGRVVSHVENSSQLDQDLNKQRNGDASEKQKGKMHNQVGDGARPELPFVKRSPIWKNIESLEAFRLTPQKPHFCPLIEKKVVTREGLAIGYMLTFSKIVESTTKLQVNDPRDTFDSYIEVLAGLEVLGFDIKLVMDRLNRLLLLKDKQEQLLHRAKGFDIQIEECAREKAKQREDIDKISKLISQLEEERAMKLSMNAAKESELISLQKVANEIKEDLSNAKHEFESLVASSW